MASRSDEPDFPAQDPRHASGDLLKTMPRAYLEAYLALLRSALPHAVYVCDARDGSVQHLNAYNGFDLGYSPAEMAAFGSPPLPIMHPDDVRKVSETLGRLMCDDGPEIFSTELRMRAHDGSWRLFRSCDMVLERGERGEVLTIMGTSHDVTALQTPDPQRAQRLRMEAIGRVSGDIAQDFGGALAGLAEAIGSARAALWDPAEAERRLALAEEALGRAEQLTARLSGLAEQQRARTETLTLSGLLADATPLLKSLFSHRFIHLDLRPTPAIRARRNRLLEVIVQLVGNASPETAALVLHCGEGSPPARRALDAPDERWALLRIEEHLRAPADATPASLAAPVAGPPSGLPAPAPSAPRMPATPMLGLGLDTARELIAESGAVIEVTHLDLRSCKLEIRFPPEARGPAVEPPTPVRDRAPRPRRILVVEDDAVLLELTQRMLTRAGHAVVCADSGEAALALWEAEGETLALVVTDVVMPRMSGLELASRLTRDRPDLPIVFASGFLQDEVTRASLSLDAPHIAFCDKPFRPEDLIAKVGALLEGAARRGPSGGPLVMK